MNCKKYLLGLVTMGLVTACTDLDPEIYSNLTTTNAYSTESDIEAAVVGLYSDMNPYPGDAWLYYGGYMIMITDYATDIGYSTAAGDPTKLSNMTYDASNRYFSNNWRDMYNVVSNANTILDNVDAVNMSEEKKNLVLRIIRKYRGVGNIMAYPFRFGVVMTKKIHAVSSFIMIIREMQNGMINLITVSITWFRKRG